MFQANVRPAGASLLGCSQRDGGLDDIPGHRAHAGLQAETADRGLQRHIVPAEALQLGDHLDQAGAAIEVLAAEAFSYS